MSTHPKVSIIFPTLNSRKLIDSFFQSLTKQTYPKSQIEVIIVDNGSYDGTPLHIKTHYPFVDLISLSKNIGFAPALNIAAKKASGKIIFVASDDVTYNKDCIKQLVLLLLSDKKIGMVSGKLLYDNGALAWSGFRLNASLGFHPYDLSGINIVRESEWFSGAAMMIKKKIFEEAGYFDEGYFFCGEDFDFSLTIRKMGYKIMYTPKALIHHVFGRNRDRMHLPPLFAHYRGKFRIVFKHGNILQISTSLIIILLVLPIIRLIANNKRYALFSTIAIYQAFVHILNTLPNIFSARRKLAKIIRNSYEYCGIK